MFDTWSQGKGGGSKFHKIQYLDIFFHPTCFSACSFSIVRISILDCNSLMRSWLRFSSLWASPNRSASSTALTFRKKNKDRVNQLLTVRLWLHITNEAVPCNQRRISPCSPASIAGPWLQSRGCLWSWPHADALVLSSYLQPSLPHTFELAPTKGNGMVVTPYDLVEENRVENVYAW